MPVSKDFLPLIGASGSQGAASYTIDQSIRFNDDDTAYMSRTPSSGGNRKKWTFSTWLKLGNSGITNSSDGLFSSVTNSNVFTTLWVNNTTYGIDLVQYNSGTTYRLNTNNLFQDPAAWYHLVAIYDSGNAVSSERMRLYLNGQRETSFYQAAYPTLNHDSEVNNTSLHSIGRAYSSSTYNTFYYDGYMAEVYLLDGYAYGPEYFGEFESNGIWIPKEYTGSYGTNGFYIKGEDSSDLGNDSSGNDNDFTTSGLAAHDQMADSPTNNFPTLTPLYGLTGITLRDGNLDGQGSTATYRRTIGTQGVSSGKWYYEGYIVATTVNNPGFGWVLTDPEDWTNYSLIGTGAHEVAGIFAATGQTHVGKAYVNNVLSSSYTSTTAAGDIFGIAVDFDNQGFYIHKNGTYYNSGDPTSGASKTGSLDASGMEAGAEYIPGFSSQDTNSRAHLNFGQDGTFGGRTTAGGNTDGNGIGNFKHSVPSGYLALCTKNLGR